MATLFSKIVSGEIPCHKIAENDKFLAFLDIMPLAKGHTLVIPKIEVDYFFDLEDEYLSEINFFAKSVAAQILEAIPCKRIGVAIIGLEVPHAHMHLVPLNDVSDINFERAKMKVTQDELAAVAGLITQA
jgi:histidine triad (HIT) family protein